MTKKTQDTTQAIVRIKNIQVELLNQYNGQEAKVKDCFSGLTGITITVICTDRRELMLTPNNYDMISGTLNPAPPNYSQNHHTAQDVRAAKANRVYAKRHHKGRTQSY